MLTPSQRDKSNHNPVDSSSIHHGIESDTATCTGKHYGTQTLYLIFVAVLVDDDIGFCISNSAARASARASAD